LRMRAIPERLRGAFTTRRYTNPRLPLPLPYCTMHMSAAPQTHGTTVSANTAGQEHEIRIAADIIV